MPYLSCQRIQSKNVVSVKGGCIEGLDWSKAIHIWTKSAMVPIPEGSETHSEESTVTTDYGSLQEELDQPTDLRGSGDIVTAADLSGGQLKGACELSG